MTTIKRFPVALLLCVPLAFAACGGDDGNSDEDQIRDIVTSVADDPAKLCDNLVDSTLQTIGGKEGCVEASKTAPDDGDPEIQSVDINGNNATVKLKDKSGENTVQFVKEGDDWKVSATP